MTSVANASTSLEEPYEAMCQQIEALRSQLEAAERLASVGELMGTTTHEFNNVLMTIINYARMGMRHQDAATRDKAFDKILTAANRAARIASSVLGFARNRSAALEPTDLAQLLEDTLLLLERELSKHRVRLERHLAKVPLALANSSQIQQVLLNLLTNARQAMPDGGRVVVRLGYDAASEMVELTVRDYGCGMDPATLRRVFEPFFTTKSGPDSSGKGGTGLGLSACRDIIEAHQGKIRVESALGRGTAFIIRLRAATAPAAAKPAAVTPGVAGPVVAGPAVGGPAVGGPAVGGPAVGGPHAAASLAQQPVSLG